MNINNLTETEQQDFYRLLKKMNGEEPDKEQDAKVKKPQQLEYYFYIDNDGDIIKSVWTNEYLDEDRWELGNIFFTEEEAKFLAKKIVGLRIFDDREGKMNWEISQVGGSGLVVSQFTLFADCSHGKRPSYINAASPEKANRLYEFFKQEIKNFGIHVESGVFQTMMSVQLINDGPVTIALDTEMLKKK